MLNILVQKILSIQTKIWLAVAVILLCSSCDDMNSLHDTYLQRGETIYVSKLDSAYFFSGRNRVKLRYWITDSRVSYLKVYWANRQDSALFDVDHSLGDSIDVFIDGISENEHLFEMITLNSEMKYPSIPYLLSGHAYGDKFQSNLINRAIQSVSQIDQVTKIFWRGQVEFGVGCELKYLSLTGDLNQKFVPMSEKVTIIEDLDIEHGLQYRTLFLPREDAIDIFYTEFTSIKILSENE